MKKYGNKYAIQKLGISTPTVLNRVKDFNEGKRLPFPDKAIQLLHCWI